MPNGHGPKKYGKHKYVGRDGTLDCKYGCGCSMGPTSSSGPTGLDPGGTCPNNPEDGKLLGGKADYDYVVTQRIRDLESRAYAAEERLRQVSPSRAELADELAEAKNELEEKDRLLANIRRLVGTGE